MRKWHDRIVKKTEKGQTVVNDDDDDDGDDGGDGVRG